MESKWFGGGGGWGCEIKGVAHAPTELRRCMKFRHDEWKRLHVSGGGVARAFWRDPRVALSPTPVGWIWD